MSGPKLVLIVAGWTLRLDPHGLVLHNTDRWIDDMAGPALEAAACTCDADEPRQVVHELPAEGLWVLMARAAHKSHNGTDPEEAASLVMAELELEHTEVTAEDDQ